MDALALYLRYLAASLRAQVQYRASFVMQACGHLFLTGIEFLGLWALFSRFGSLAGWTLRDGALLYGMVDVGFGTADLLGRGFDSFGSMVKSGDFDRLLVRPRSPVLQLMGQELPLRRVGRVFQGAVVLVWAGWRLPWDLAKGALLLGALAGAASLFLGLLVLQATSTFWTTETLEVLNAFTYGGNYAADYPMSIYRPWFRRFFTAVIPLACVLYWPALALLDKPPPAGMGRALEWLGPVAGPLFLGVSLLVWKLGVRRYTSTGS